MANHKQCTHVDLITVIADNKCDKYSMVALAFKLYPSVHKLLLGYIFYLKDTTQLSSGTIMNLVPIKVT